MVKSITLRVWVRWPTPGGMRNSKLPQPDPRQNVPDISGTWFIFLFQVAMQNVFTFVKGVNGLSGATRCARRNESMTEQTRPKRRKEGWYESSNVFYLAYFNYCSQADPQPPHN